MSYTHTRNDEKQPFLFSRKTKLLSIQVDAAVLLVAHLLRAGETVASPPCPVVMDDVLATSSHGHLVEHLVTRCLRFRVSMSLNVESDAKDMVQR